MANSQNLKPLDKKSIVPVQINAKKIALWLGIFALILVAVSLAAQIIRYIGGVEDAYGLIPTMDVDRELSVPSIFSVLLLLMLTLLLSLISMAKHQEKDKFRWYWTILVLGFMVMTFDEGASIHELLGVPIRAWFGSSLPDFMLFGWVLPGILIVLLLAVFFLKFYLSMPNRTKIGIVVSSLVYLGGLLAMEMVGSHYASQFGIKNLHYNILVTIEEALEMGGLILAIYTFLDYLEAELKEICLEF